MFADNLLEDLQQKFQLEEDAARRLRKAVPEYHALIGSTIEMHDIPTHRKEYVLDCIAHFLNEVDNWPNSTRSD